VLIKQNPDALTLTPLEWFQLIQIFDALPTQWRTSLTSCGPKSGKAFVLNDHIKLRLKNQVLQINKASSKNILIRKFDQDMILIQLRKGKLRNSTLTHA